MEAKIKNDRNLSRGKENSFAYLCPEPFLDSFLLLRVPLLVADEHLGSVHRLQGLHQRGDGVLVVHAVGEDHEVGRGVAQGGGGLLVSPAERADGHGGGHGGVRGRVGLQQGQDLWQVG